MTYHAGISSFGADREPGITCDGCGLVYSCLRPSGVPYSWCLDNKAPPGWKLVRVEEPFSRKDYCRMCKTKVQS